MKSIFEVLHEKRDPAACLADFDAQAVPRTIANQEEAAKYFKPSQGLLVAINAAMAVGALLLLAAGCAGAPAPAPSPSAIASAPAPPGSTVIAAPASNREPIEVALTVDDLPVHGPAMAGLDRIALADRMLAIFKAHRMPPVVGFVNGKKVDDAPATEAVLQRWIASGNRLGNHTYAHVSLNKQSVPDYLADLERGEVILRKLQPDPAAWKVFRYPFLYEGDTQDKRIAVRAYLAAHGYAIAEVSVEADDWAFNAPFVRCTERGDSTAIAALHRRFVEVHLAELDAMRALGRTLTGHEARQVLLLHLGVADVDALDDLLTAYERAGVRFIELGRALADPLYAIDPGQPFRFGAAFPYLVAKARGVPAPAPAYARDLEDELDRLCR